MMGAIYLVYSAFYVSINIEGMKLFISVVLNALYLILMVIVLKNASETRNLLKAQQRCIYDNEIDLAISFSPGEATAAIANGLLPDSVRTSVLDKGTIGNASFVAIPYNAAAREGALVLANFLISPEAQKRKQHSNYTDPYLIGAGKKE